MTKEELSRCYFIAVSRLQEQLVVMYEELHDEQGQPLASNGKVELLLSGFRAIVKSEFDLIRESSIEFIETNGNSSLHR